MAALYARWVAAGARLHFVSNSPHQLFLPLSEFAATACFPAATWHLKRVRMTYSSVVRLLQNPPDAKRPPLESLLEHYPRRRFILVGDTGESDPELYGWAARHYPDQIRWILLRDVTGEPPDAERYRQAFADIPGERWQLFTHSDQIKISLD
jgi:phosphatidate phosphatase APP1